MGPSGAALFTIEQPNAKTPGFCKFAGGYERAQNYLQSSLECFGRFSQHLFDVNIRTNEGISLVSYFAELPSVANVKYIHRTNDETFNPLVYSSNLTTTVYVSLEKYFGDFRRERPKYWFPDVGEFGYHIDRYTGELIWTRKDSSLLRKKVYKYD